MYFKSTKSVHFRCILAILFVLFLSANETVSALFLSKEKEEKISLNSSDNKKLEKASKELQRSKDVMKEADKIYEEIASKQTELTSEESEKLNNKALTKQIESLKIQQSSNKMKFDVYAAKADEFWKKYTGNPDDMAYAKSLESSARLSFQSSEEQYKEAEKGDDKLISYSSMTSSADLSNKAVDDLKKAFDIYSTTPYEGGVAPLNPVQPIEESTAVTTDTVQSTPIYTPGSTETNTEKVNSPNIYQAVKVNENMVDQFNKFIQEKYPQDYEKYIVDFSSVDYSDVNALRDAWNKYLYGNIENPEAAVQSDTLNKADSLTVASNLQDSTTVLANNISSASEVAKRDNEGKTGEKVKSKKAKTRKIKRTAADYAQADSSIQSTISDKYSRFESVSGFVFRVQIVASRVPMNNDMLRLIYEGTGQPEENFENEWYKYSIGPFSTFAQARQFKYDCGVKGAFVVAFLNGKKINPNQELISSGQNSNSFANFNNGGDLVYKIQIAACRNEIPVDELKRIYENTEQLESSFEDNWYKYLINCGNDYNKACTLLKNLRIAGAFIAIYRDGTRISLK